MTCIGEIEKKEMVKSIMKRQIFLSSWVFVVVVVVVVVVVFEKMSSLLPMLLVLLFIHVGKRSNSLSQMFFKTGALKNFVIFTGNAYVWVSF